MKRFRGWSLILLIIPVIVFGACTSSSVDPDADVSIAGTVTGPADLPLADRPVVLTREPDLGEVFVTGAFVGLPCLTTDPPPICEGARKQETDSEGRFAFSIKGRDTQGFLGQASTLALSTSAARTRDQIEGPAVSHRFQVQTTSLAMPLRLWGTDVSVTGDISNIMVAFQPVTPDLLPGDGGGTLNTSVRFQRSSGELVWLSENYLPSTPIDTRVLEDTVGDVSVLTQASDIPATAAAGSKVTALFRSGRWRYESPVGAPFSRGKTCFVDTSGGPQALNPCLLTDGVFDEPMDPCPTGDCPEGAGPSSVRIDLGEVTEITLVVVRGCVDRCGIQLSSDGTSWSPLSTAQSSGEFGAASENVLITAPAGSSGRFVRIDMERTGLSSLKEVSVWGPVTPPSQRSASGSILREPPNRDSGTGSAREWVPFLVAAIVVLAIAAIVVARRRGRGLQSS